MKIRDLSKVGDILSGATAKGANNIGDLSFTIDNEDQVKENAKELAIADAKTNAKNLEKALGVKLTKIVNYSEGSSVPTPIYNIASSQKMMSAGAIESPTIETGQNKITSTVTITYAIKY